MHSLEKVSQGYARAWRRSEESSRVQSSSGIPKPCRRRIVRTKVYVARKIKGTKKRPQQASRPSVSCGRPQHCEKEPLYCTTQYEQKSYYCYA